MMCRRIREWASRPRISPLAVKVFVVAIATLTVAVPLGLIAMPYIDFFNDMAVQPKVKPQMLWVHDRGHEVPGDRYPVAGTVAQGTFDYPFPTPPELREPVHETPEARAARIVRLDEFQAESAAALQAGGPDIAPPYRRVAPTMQTMKQGEKQFQSTCIVCHGEFGVGNGRVASRGFPPPQDLLSKRVRAFPDERIFQVITTGRNAMPSYATHIPPAERWAVIHYVRALEEAFPP